MKELLLKQYRLYPRMRIQDAVKLIYQNEFGVGHMISDEADSLKRLRGEIMDLQQSPSSSTGTHDTGLFEYIGNGLFRLNLKALKNTCAKVETVNRFLIYTADTVSGNIESFEKKLNVLIQCCKNGELPFLHGELSSFLRDYRYRGYPPIGHSEAYRNSYFPSYRVVREEFHDFFGLFDRIDNLMESKTTVTVAIDGNSGSGKSALSELLGFIYDCNIFHTDSYFLRPEQKTRSRIKEIGGNVDYERLKDEVINGLKAGGRFSCRVYDCRKQELGKPVPVYPKKLNIIEGVYSLHPTLADFYDLKAFLRTDEKTQKIRILKRDGKAMLQRFLREWIPQENRYFNEMKIMDKCDLVFNS